MSLSFKDWLENAWGSHQSLVWKQDLPALYGRQAVDGMTAFTRVSPLSIKDQLKLDVQTIRRKRAERIAKKFDGSGKHVQL